MPPASGTAAPSCVAPSKNVTVPLGTVAVPATAGATVALSVTDCTGVAVIGFTLTTVTDACCATPRLNVAVAVSPLASVTVTVYVIAALTTVGVPVITPVFTFSVSPMGRPGDTLYVSGDVPPDPVTGMNGTTVWSNVRPSTPIDCTATTALLTIRLKFAVAVAPLASVTVTV
jgi:hypothetical protein